MAGDIDLGIDGLEDYKEIGSGGFATVYSALEVDLDRRVAVKVLAAIDDAGRRRFDRERLTMGRTADHPNIVTPLRSGYTGTDNKPYLVMEYLSRGSLQDLIDTQGPMPWRQVIEVILPIADALGFSHSSGVVHKDVKPANILVSRTGVVKLSDFGIAAIREATSTSQVAYSILYTAPETFDAGQSSTGQGVVDPRDERSDLYSLAATLFALGMGRPPFLSASAAGLIGQIVSTAVPRTGHAALDEFLAVAMAKDPADRYPTGAHFIAAVRSLALEPASVNATSHRASPPPVAPPPSSGWGAGTVSQGPEPRLATQPPNRPPEPAAIQPVSGMARSAPPRASSSSAPAEPSRAGGDGRGVGLLRPGWAALVVGLALGVVAAVGYLGLGAYNRSFWYIAQAGDGTVGVYQGRPGGLLWLDPVLQPPAGPTVSDLIPEDQDQMARRPTFKSEADARAFVDSLTLAGEMVKDQAAQLGGVEASTTTAPG